MLDMRLDDPGFWMAVGTSLGCGALIGLERQIGGNPAGIRTCAMVSLGAALFAWVGGALQVEGGDPTRMPGQIVVGVGFLGAGVIMHRRRTVSGLTSASVVWLLAAIGMLAGLGAHDAALAITGVVLACVVVLGRLEARLPWLHRGAHAHKDPRTRNGRSERPGPREDDEDADPGQA